GDQAPAHPSGGPEDATGWTDVPALTVDGIEYTRFTEATEREVFAERTAGQLTGADGAEIPFHIDAGEKADDLAGADGTLAGRLVHQWDALDGMLRVRADRVAGPYQALRPRLWVANHNEPGGA